MKKVSQVGFRRWAGGHGNFTVTDHFSEEPYDQVLSIGQNLAFFIARTL
jgi:hypothetical protein